MEHKAKVLWQSEGRQPNGVPFLSVKEARGYYVYAERGGVDSIAFILYDKDTNKVGLIRESKPPLDEMIGEKVMLTTAFGGSLDDDSKTSKEICQIEVLEEAGYDVPMEDIYGVGSALVSTQMSQFMHGYLVDVTGLTAGKTETDYQNEAQDLKDPDEFKHNKVIWVDIDGLMRLDDWKGIFIYFRAMYQDLI